MKRSISINLSGILFHIEEDAYERLSQYLNEIKAYFNRIDSSGEVIQDIESRMAEVFSQKVGPTKQVITSEDVEQLITQLGSVQDFAAAYADDEAEANYVPPTGAYSTASASTEPKKLFRDAGHKILGGVASGIARYLGIDAIWVRLLLVIIMFDFFITFSFSTLTFIGYIVLWIALPEKVFPEASGPGKEKTKKLFRNPNDKVIGGVAGGLGAYFGADATLIRIFFVLLLIFGGSGFLLYVILWAIVPEARTITDKMQMQGEPVTLSNIEHQVKKKLNLPENEEESVITRVLLFPFRLISAIFSGGSGSGMNSAASVIGKLIRIFVGLILAFIGFVLLLSLIFTILAFVGVYPGINLEFLDTGISFADLHQILPTYLWAALAALLIIPVLFILMSGISFLAGSWRIPREIGWGLAGLWIIALLVALFTAPRIAAQFAEEGYHDSRLNLSLADSSELLSLKLSDSRSRKYANFDNNHYRLTLYGTSDSVMYLEQRAYANSESEEMAQEVAASIKVPVKQTGNTIYFEDHFPILNEGKIAFQELELALYIPNGQRFTMDRSMRHILYKTLYPYDYRVSDLGKDNIFYYNERSELVCENCPKDEDDNDGNERIRSKSRDRETSSSGYNGSSWTSDFNENDLQSAGNYTDFSEVEVSGALKVKIIQGEEYRVSYAYSGSDNAISEVEIDRRGRTLEISHGRQWNQDRADDLDKLLIVVEMPDITDLSATGASKIELDTKQGGTLTLKAVGASTINANVEVARLKIDMNSASNINLSGECDQFYAEGSGGANLNAYDLNVQDAELDLSSAASAKVDVSDRLDANVSSGANISYKGNPRNKQFNKSTGGNIRQED